MYSLTIAQFNRNIEDKDKAERIKYAVSNLANAEDIVLNARACKDIDALEEYIEFLK